MTWRSAVRLRCQRAGDLPLPLPMLSALGDNPCMAVNSEEERELETLPQDREQHRRSRIPADTFSVRLLLARHLAGNLSIRDASELAGLNRGNWQGWERGLRPRDIVDVATKVAKALDVDFTWLLLGGPLLSARGLPVERPGGDTSRYPKVAIPTPRRSTDGGPPTSDGNNPGRRPVRVGMSVAA